MAISSSGCDGANNTRLGAGPRMVPQGEFKNGSRRRKEADFGAKNTSAFATRQSAASARRRSASLPRRLRLLRQFLNSPWNGPSGFDFARDIAPRLLYSRSL